MKKQLSFPWGEAETVLHAILEESVRQRQLVEHIVQPKQIFDHHDPRCEGCLEPRAWEDEILGGEGEPPRTKKKSYGVR